MQPSEVFRLIRFRKRRRRRITEEEAEELWPRFMHVSCSPFNESPAFIRGQRGVQDLKSVRPGDGVVECKTDSAASTSVRETVSPSDGVRRFRGVLSQCERSSLLHFSSDTRIMFYKKQLIRNICHFGRKLGNISYPNLPN